VNKQERVESSNHILNQTPQNGDRFTTVLPCGMKVTCKNNNESILNLASKFTKRRIKLGTFTQPKRAGKRAHITTINEFIRDDEIENARSYIELNNLNVYDYDFNVGRV